MAGDSDSQTEQSIERKKTMAHFACGLGNESTCKSHNSKDDPRGRRK